MTIFYNAFHSPIGAHSSFTLGCKGPSGGLGLELEKPADEDIYIGIETRKGGEFKTLPFYVGSNDEAARFDHAKKNNLKTSALSAFSDKEIKREYNLSTDCWKAGDLEFTIYSPVQPAPDPENTSAKIQKQVYCPAVLAELTIDNTKSKKPRRAFFGYQAKGTTDNLRWYNSNNMNGIIKGQQTAILSADKNVETAVGFTPDHIFKVTDKKNYKDGLGETGFNIVTAAPGKRQTFRFAICFFRGGIVTTGMQTSYWYYRFFKNIESVGKYALANFSVIKRNALKADKLAESKKLNNFQRFQLIHAIRSYYGSTQLLDYKGKPIWVVNEGEYRMMNTFDLTVDQLFFEIKMNAWTVKNELGLFTSRYSYTDKLHFPGGKNKHPGGISFTHDMGHNNQFSRPGYSTYEKFGLDGCFSHMTHEQLVNWILCAAVYAKQTGDKKWLKENISVFSKCLRSMMNRDNPKDLKRNGIMSLDSDRTLDGAEITTYDSLDVSLGQARNNVYIAVKGWAAYLAMEEIFDNFKMKKEAARSAKQAARAADTISSFLNKEGYIPAVMGEKCNSKIIPAVEGLVFPYVLQQKDNLKQNGKYGHLIKALHKHLTTVLKKGTCIYPDNGWKLSSSADNSWLSKIYLCQFVTRKVLGINNPATTEKADKAHRNWLLKEENLYFAWSDQICSGIARGSKYYPRGVTSILWLEE
ncbi:MAG: glycoside hydrolase family 52 protein [Planctomycetota bacterium]|jgi:hypothetical protein